MVVARIREAGAGVVARATPHRFKTTICAISFAADVKFVQTFIDLYPALAAEAEASQEPSRKLTRVASDAPSARPAPRRAS